MTVRVVTWSPTADGRKRFRVDVRCKTKEGTPVRDRTVVELATMKASIRWGEQRQSDIYSGAYVVPSMRVEPETPPEPVTVITWDEFWLVYIRACAAGVTRRGKREKASSLDNKRGTNTKWLSPHLGKLPLDRLDDAQISAFRTTLAESPGRQPGTMLSPKRVNNVLTVILSALKYAVKIKMISALPCNIEISAIEDARPVYFDFVDYERLAEGAAKVGTREAVVVRLGGDAGLRRSEMMALRWDQVDFTRKRILVEHGAWRRSTKTVRRDGGEQMVIASPKGGRSRSVDMSDALVTALKAHRHIRGPYVLCLADGSMAAGHLLKDWLEAAERKAGLPIRGALHRLRHTFCTHLAMRGASTKAIQELAGHRSSGTTERYMWASPASTSAAIALLNQPVPAWARASAE